MNEKIFLKDFKENLEFQEIIKLFTNDIEDSKCKKISEEELETLDELFEIAEILANDDTIKVLQKMKEIIFSNSR